jgi:putative endopeptidase
LLTIGLLTLMLLGPLAVKFRDNRPAQAGQSLSRGYNPANLDKTCKPCDNFFQFANGGWLKNNPIPAEYPAWGSFIRLVEENQKRLRTILDSAAADKSAAPGSNEQKIGDFYASCMDTPAIDALADKPISLQFAQIDRLKDPESISRLIAHFHAQGVDGFFALSAMQDLKGSNHVIGEADPAGLGLPSRNYYTSTDVDSRKLREKYVEHVAKMFTMLGDSAEKSTVEGKTVLDIETSFANASITNVEFGGPEIEYHTMNLSQLSALTPHFAWRVYIETAGHPELTQINIGQPQFFKEMDKQLATRSLDDWKTYLRWHLIHSTAQFLSEPFVQEDFNFNVRILTGTKELRPRWKRCSSATDRYLGEALGQLYVQKYFPPEAKTSALEMLHDLIAALRDVVPTVSWMSPEAKKAAIAKLATFGFKIGYPDKWRDYSSLKIDRGPYISNVFRAAQFETARDLNKIGESVDRAEWSMTVPTVDAYSDSQLNEIVFPAGILQPPFFDPNRDAAYNYGGIGAVMGHEIIHDFEDQGPELDLHGDKTNWWTLENLKKFQDRGDCISSQFSSYIVDGDLHENGNLVEDESIADLGGLTIAYAAYQKHLQGRPQETDSNGFAPDQRFFLGFAQIWAVNFRPEATKLWVNTNPHPLPRFRTNGPISNMVEFARAFGCKKGDPMVRETACKIW